MAARPAPSANGSSFPARVGALVGHAVSPAIVFDPVYEPVPVEIVHVSLRTGAHEAGGHNLSAVKPALLVERLAVDQSPGTLTLPSSALLLHDEPLGEAPHSDAL